MNRAERRAAIKRDKAAATRAMRAAARRLSVATFTDTINNARPPEDGELTDSHIQTRLEFSRLIDGSADEADFASVAVLINICTVRAIEIDEMLTAELTPAHVAMRACFDRYKTCGRFGFTGPELQVMRNAIDVCEAISGASSVTQMRHAAGIAGDVVAGRGHASRHEAARKAQVKNLAVS